jgi:hypothetical protein
VLILAKAGLLRLDWNARWAKVRGYSCRILPSCANPHGTGADLPSAIPSPASPVPSSSTEVKRLVQGLAHHRNRMGVSVSATGGVAPSARVSVSLRADAASPSAWRCLSKPMNLRKSMSTSIDLIPKHLNDEVDSSKPATFVPLRASGLVQNKLPLWQIPMTRLSKCP